MKWYEFFLDGTFLALAGAAIAVIVAGIGSARAVGLVGEAAAGLISEEPERFGQTLLLQALPGTQGIYGLLTAFVILTKIGVVGGGNVEVGTVQGLLLFGAAIPLL